jgi:predicted ribosome quality control (RQC) complex YloA/Tae2 family protein
MPPRSSPNQLKSSDDLQQLQELVVDKRYGKRAKAKKNRRNRHYEKQFMRNAVSSGILVSGGEDPSEES